MKRHADGPLLDNGPSLLMSKQTSLKCPRKEQSKLKNLMTRFP